MKCENRKYIMYDSIQFCILFTKNINACQITCDIEYSIPSIIFNKTDNTLVENPYRSPPKIKRKFYTLCVADFKNSLNIV